MATTGIGASKRASTQKTTGTGRVLTSGRQTRTSTQTHAQTRFGRAQVLAQRAVLVPVGASLVARDRRRLEREVRLVRRDLEKQSDTFSHRVEKMLREAQDRLSSVA